MFLKYLKLSLITWDDFGVILHPIITLILPEKFN